MDMSKDCSYFMQMIDYNSKDVVRFFNTIGTDNHLWMPYKCTKFQLDWSTVVLLTLIYQYVVLPRLHIFLLLLVLG